ncbi:hypothetical protein, partial [Escherichia coli]|uniref:hypothetical protein n=1 Tax=Escherichia coli TaxID=562 RepID=UPI001954C622
NMQVGAAMFAISPAKAGISCHGTCPPPKGLAFAEMTVDKVLPPLRCHRLPLVTFATGLDLCGALVSRGAETTIER